MRFLISEHKLISLAKTSKIKISEGNVGRQMKNTNLWYEFKSGNRVWIGYECKTSAAFHHLTDICYAAFVCQMAQYTEYRETCQHRCECVQCGDDRCISVYIVIEAIEWSIHNQITKAYGQWEEALCNCCIPHLMQRKCEFIISFFFNKIKVVEF